MISCVKDSERDVGQRSFLYIKRCLVENCWFQLKFKKEAFEADLSNAKYVILFVLINTFQGVSQEQGIWSQKTIDSLKRLHTTAGFIR